MFKCDFCRGRTCNGVVNKKHPIEYPEYYHGSGGDDICYDCRICGAFLNDKKHDKLTDRDLVQLLSEGWQVQEIAVRYQVHRSTVSRHLSRLRERYQYRPLALLDLAPE